MAVVRKIFGEEGRRMPVIRTKVGSGRPKANAPNNYLWNHRNNVFSQSGEDGVIEEIFRKIGTTNKWCVEFGAWDGIHLSNTCNLIRNSGWSAVLIEAEEKKAAKIKSNYPNDDVHPICAMLGFTKGVDTLDDYLKTTPIPKQFDLVSIDVDGMDYHLWESMVEYRPRAVVVEFNHLVPNDVIFIQDRDGKLNEGHSLAALVELGKSRDYELVGVVHRNAFFVVKEEFHKFQPEITDNSIDAIRPFQPSYIWSCYNGKMYHTLERLRWGRGADQFELKPDSIQLFKEFWWRDQFQGGERQPEEASATVSAAHPASPAPASSPAAIATGGGAAEDILREMLEIRKSRKELTPEERGSRQKKAWQAARAYFKQGKQRRAK